MRKVLGGARWFLVTVGIIAVTSITIDATSSYSLSQSALGILAREITDMTCADGMVEVMLSEKRFCIDAFEVSPSKDCPYTQIRSSDMTLQNSDIPTCIPVSVSGVSPWVHVTFIQARELCARVGKRLPTHQEWYSAALGIADPAQNPVCNIDSGVLKNTGAYEECLGGSGAYDMVGNVWEWVEGVVVDGEYAGRPLPVTGYVAGVDEDGVARTTVETKQSGYHDDYFWSEAEGDYAMMRGGFYGSGADAGLYSIHADIDPSFSVGAVGFRCVHDL